MGKHVFMSNEVFEKTVKQAAEETVYQRGFSDALRESRSDFDEGRYYGSRDDMLAAIEAKREAVHA